MQARALAYVITGCVFAGGLYLRFNYEPTLPPRPPRPATTDIAAFRALDYDPNIYRARVEQDAAELGVRADPLTQNFRFDSTEPDRLLQVGGAPLDTPNLTLSLRSARMTIKAGKGTVETDHLILRIENRTGRHLAYRVDAELPLDPRGCVQKADLPLDAIAIAPHETLERTECGRDGVDHLTIARVETMELPPLAYYYVSQLFPAHIGLDARATHGHTPPKGSVCGDVPEQAIRRGMEKGQVSWRDVVDFYARHTCAKYIFQVGYRAFTRPDERPLPVKPGSFAPGP